MNVNTWAGIASAVIALSAFIIDHWQAASGVLSEIWQRMFVNLWFLWLGGSIYGVWWVFQFQRRLNQRVNAFEESLRTELNSIHTEVRQLIEDSAKSLRTGIAQEGQRRSSQDAGLEERIHDQTLELVKVYKHIELLNSELNKLSDCIPEEIKNPRGLIDKARRW